MSSNTGLCNTLCTEILPLTPLTRIVQWTQNCNVSGYIHVKACSNQALWNISTHASWNWVSVWFAISEEWPRCPCLFHAVTQIRRSAPKPPKLKGKLNKNKGRQQQLLLYEVATLFSLWSLNRLNSVSCYWYGRPRKLRLTWGFWHEDIRSRFFRAYI